MKILGVAAVLSVGDGFALQLRDADAELWPGCWALFGGRVEAGETPERAIVRELREELELYVSAPRPLMDFGAARIFTCEVTRQWPRHVLHEGARARVFSYAAAMRLESLTEASRAALARAAAARRGRQPRAA